VTKLVTPPGVIGAELGYNPAALWLRVKNPKARTDEINP
jgi:hypothetical protein